MPFEKPDHVPTVPSDAVVAGAVERVRRDFPSVSALAIMSHLTFLRANAVYSETLGRLYGQLGLSRSRFNLLWVLYRSESARLSIGELGDNIGITAPSVMKMIQSLETEGWVRTLKGTTDRRVTFVEMTENGLERFADLLGEALRSWEEMWSELGTGEMSSLITALAKLRASLLHRYLGEPGLAAFRARHHDEEPLQSAQPDADAL